jgi:hypothetical protein
MLPFKGHPISPTSSSIQGAAVCGPNGEIELRPVARRVSDVRLALNDRSCQIIRAMPRRGHLLAISTRVAEAESHRQNPPLGNVLLPRTACAGLTGVRQMAKWCRCAWRRYPAKPG